MNVADWLRTLGLGQYEAAFRENSVGMDVLPNLTAGDLKDLGVNAVGDRRRLLHAIAALRPGGEHDGPQNAEEWLAERRQLTVMFCDIAGSTALSTRLDPEDLSVMVRLYQSIVRSTLSRFGGFIARYVGDGVLIYFGWPEAHETNAESAVRAALAVIAAVNENPIHGESLSIRIGIATGLVVVGAPIGEGDARQQTAIGETPNLAARLQGLAGANGIVIDAATRQQVGGFFKFRDLGTITLKGLPNPVPAWEVLEESAVESRFEALRADRMTPLVGRQEELELLRRRWVRAASGEGQVVLLSGEPGIGKSRLVQTLLERIAGELHTRVRCFCSPHHQDSALYPSIAQLERAAAFRRDDTAEQRLDKLELLLAQATDTTKEAAPLIAELLSIPSTGRYPPLELTPQMRKEKTLRALLAQFEGLAARQPVLMLLEDAHWSDPTSIELLDLIVDRASSLRLLLIVTFRPEFAAPWTGRPHVSVLSLSRLRPREQGAIIAGVTGGKSLPNEVAEQIIDRTDGVPLFVEELTKAVIESGMLTDLGDRYVAAGPVPSLAAIPATLHGSLLARLDRMAPVREVAQIGAALGRRFSHELISAVAAMPQPQLDGALARLVGAELVYRRGIPPDAEYTFKHALVQDAAYQSMLKSRRAHWHACIADTLERSFPELVDAQPETLARHLTAAALAQKAIPYWLAAGRRSLQRSAMREAIVQLNSGIGLLAGVQDETARTELELHLQYALGLAYRAARGFAAPEVEAAFARAHELCLRTGKTAELAPVVRGLAASLWMRGNVSAGKALVLQLLENADTASNDELAASHGLMGCLLSELGERSESEAHLAIAHRLWNPQMQLSAAQHYTGDLVHLYRCYHAINLTHLGHVDTALAVAREALALARSGGNSQGITAALVFAATCSVRLRDLAGAVHFAEEALVTAKNHGFAYWGSRARSILGWVSAWQAGAREGVNEIREVLASARSVGNESFVLGTLGLLSEAELATSDPNAAAEVANEALHWRERNAPYSRSHGFLHYLRGDAMVALGDQMQAEADFHRALVWSRERNEKWHELNAAFRLARLWQADGRPGDARDLLATVYGWFTEGFDNPVLRDAKALLEELTSTIDSAAVSDCPGSPRNSQGRDTGPSGAVDAAAVMEGLRGKRDESQAGSKKTAGKQHRS
jgi:class 3 adenylate cyclase/tetratricopeptide (TPR) repeat protein